MPESLTELLGRVRRQDGQAVALLVEHLNMTRDMHVVMLEHYSEFLFEPKRALIQQRQVGVDAPDMLAGIRSALLQGADAVFVSEIPDPEELAACVSAAASRLVLIQLHQPSPEAAIDLLIELQPEESRPRFRGALAAQLRVALAQILLPTANGDGRVPAYGVLIPDDTTRKAIASGEPLTDRRPGRAPGCQTIAEDVAELRAEGLVTAEAARLATEQG